MTARWVGAALALLVLAGCGTETVAGDPERDRGTVHSGGPVDLPVPLELRPVVDTAPSDAQEPPPSGRTLSDAEGTTYTLAEPFLTVNRLEDAGVELAQADQWVVNLRLTKADGAVFGDWTAGHVNERLAMVFDDRVLFAPTVQGAIPDGEVQVSGNYTRDEATALLKEITGR